VGPQLARLHGQETLRAFDGVERCVCWQVADERLDHRQGLWVKDAVPPDLSGRGQFRRQRFTGDRDARHQLLSVAHPATSFGATDSQPVRDDLVHWSADVGRILVGQAGEEVMASYELTTSGPLPTVGG